MKKNLSSFIFHLSTQKGFTLVELILVMTIMATLIGFITINLTGSLQNASLVSAEEMLITDLRQQQLKSMIGDTEGRASSDQYGIHFDSDRYVLFHGTYSILESSNSTINLEDNMQFNAPLADIVFSKISGEILSPAIIELQDNTNSKMKRIHLNKYGVVTQVESL